MIFWIFLQDDVQVPLLVSGISAFVNLHDFQVFQVIPMVWAFSNSGETSNHFVTSKDLGGSKNVFFCCIFWPWNYQGEWFWTGGLRGSRSLDHGQTKNMNLGRVGIAYLPTPPIIPWWSMHNCITDSATTSCPRNTHIHDGHDAIILSSGWHGRSCTSMWLGSAILVLLFLFVKAEGWRS